LVYWFKILNDDYNQVKLDGFTKYLSDIDPELSERLHPLGITPKGGIYSITKLKNPCSQEDLDEMGMHWKEYIIDIYRS
jgi:hypothetical protein